MNVLPIKKEEYFEIRLNGGTAYSRIFLEDIPTLRNALVRGIEVYTESNFATGITGDTLVPTATLQQVWFTLELYNGKQFINQRPIQRFFADTLTSPLAPFNPRDLTGQKINFPKCFIDFAPNYTPMTDEVICISVFYQSSAEIEAKDAKAKFTERS